MSKIYNSTYFYNPECTFKNELFKPIDGHDDYYISNMGRVLSTKYSTDSILKCSLTKLYLVVTLSRRNKRLTHRVHRLVGIHWVDNSLKKNEINHLNADKLDNRASNLEWCTRLENASHAASLGLYQKGENRYNSKLKEKDVIQIRSSFTLGAKVTELAKKHNVCESTIRMALNRTRWKHVK